MIKTSWILLPALYPNWFQSSTTVPHSITPSWMEGTNLPHAIMFLLIQGNRSFGDRQEKQRAFTLILFYYINADRSLNGQERESIAQACAVFEGLYDFLCFSHKRTFISKN